MKSKCRVWITTILFAAVSAVVLAQSPDNGSGSPPPPPQQETTPALPPALTPVPAQQTLQMANTPAATPAPTLTASPIPTPLLAPTTVSGKAAARQETFGRKAGAPKHSAPV